MNRNNCKNLHEEDSDRGSSKTKHQEVGRSISVIANLSKRTVAGYVDPASRVMQRELYFLCLLPDYQLIQFAMNGYSYRNKEDPRHYRRGVNGQGSRRNKGQHVCNYIEPSRFNTNLETIQ